MLVVKKFRVVDNFMKGFTAGFGITLGLGFSIIPIKAAFLALLFVVTLIAGTMITFAVILIYRIFFSDGVPDSPTSDIISPNWYGKVARRHFVLFAKTLALSWIGLVVLKIFFVIR